MIVQKGGQVTKPIIIVKMPCNIVCHSSKRILNKMFNFLALLDIRVFGRLYLWLLIGLALFYTQAVFVFSISLLFVSIQKQNMSSCDKKPSVFAPRMFLDSIWLLCGSI